MRSLKNLSIRTKLIFLATISACVAVLLTSAAFVWNDMNVMRGQKIRQSQLHVDMMHFSPTSLKRLEDPKREKRRAQYLEKRLSDLLSKVPTIVYGCLYDANGEVLTTFERDQNSERQPPALESFGNAFSENGELELFRPIRDENRHVASIYVVDSADDTRSMFLQFLKIAGYVTLFSCLLSFLLSIRLQSLIARPIQKLSTAVNAVGSGETPPPVKIINGRDEISTLERSFYKMLHDVHEANSELENRVDDRTSQLRMEIAERKKIEADLIRARDSAEEANRSKSRFLANMSHEIRTPLNAILGFSELLKKGVVSTDEERTSFLTTIISSGKHLLELINGILDLSKIEAGQMELERRRFSPDHIIADALSVMHVKAAEKGLELTYQWSTGVPETIENDEARMRQALINLIGNAIKFTDKGGVHVSGRLIVERMPAMLEISVRDTGIGIPQDKLETIFEPFVQADASVTRRFGGTGLGLAITRKIARLLGGDLHVSSQVGAGSQFTISLTTGLLNGVPIRPEPIAKIDTQQQVDEMSRTDLSGIRVLLVEDVAANRKLIQIILRRTGAQVVEAENGQRGFEAAMAERFDVILMDMQMPVLDGYQATRKLREHGCNVPIVALTANAMKGDDSACFEAGCNGYLAKPIDTNEVLKCLRETVGRSPATQNQPDPNTQPGILQPLSPAPNLSVQDVLFGTPQQASTGTAASNVSAAPQNAPATSPTTFGQPQVGQTQSHPSADRLRSQLPMDDEEFREIAVEFAERLRIQIPQLQQASQMNDLRTIEQLAHMIKGTGGTAGFPDFTKPANTLMKQARSGQMQGIDALIAEIASLSDRIELPQ